MDFGLERKSSIENEPRTLGIDQIQIAREAAIYVLSTTSGEEACRIFTQGLEPAIGCVRGYEETLVDYDEELESLTNQLRSPGLRDIVSAPF